MVQSISYNYNKLSKYYVRQSRVEMNRALASRGIFLNKKKIHRYKRLAFSALITKRIIFQQFYYFFLSRLLKWFKFKLLKETEQRNACTCFSLGLLRSFYFFSIGEIKNVLFDFLDGIPDTIIPNKQKNLILSRIRTFAKPFITDYDYIQNIFGQFYFSKGNTYLDYGDPSANWIINFFKKRKNRYKLSSLSLFSGYKGRHFFQIRNKRSRNKRKKILHKKGHKYIFDERKKVDTLKNNAIFSFEVRAETYLKYFYDYSLPDIHKITYVFFKIFPSCSLGLIFYFLNKRLDFLVHRKFCNFRMSAIREVLKKGLVSVNGIIIKNPSYIVRTGQLISFNLFQNDIKSSYLIGLFISMFSIRNNILRSTLKSKIYKILLNYLRYKTIVVQMPFFKKYIKIKDKTNTGLISFKKHHLARSFSKLKKKKELIRKKKFNLLKSKLSNLPKHTQNISRQTNRTNYKKIQSDQKRSYTFSLDYKKEKGEIKNVTSIKNKRLPNNTFYKKPRNKSTHFVKKKHNKFSYNRHRPYKKKKVFVVHYKDISGCENSFHCKKKFRNLLSSKRYITKGQDNMSKNYGHKKNLRLFQRRLSHKLSTNLRGQYDVFNWEKEFSNNQRFLRNSKKVLFIKYLKQIKSNIFSIFLSMCRKQKYFMNNINLSMPYIIDDIDSNTLLKNINSEHLKYRGLFKRGVKPRRYYTRIRSFGVKLFIKYLKNLNSSLDSNLRKKYELYNILINATPTKFHKVLAISNYMLLLRYRQVLPCVDKNSTYFNFECLRINPLNYIRRGSLIYENKSGSSKMILRNHWFIKNKYYLPR